MLPLNIEDAMTTTTTTVRRHLLATMSQDSYDKVAGSTIDYNLVKHAAARVLQNGTNPVTDDEQEPEWKRLFCIVMSNILLFALIFGLSATVDSRNLRKQLSNKFAIGCGVAMQYIFMPLLGCVSVCVFSQFGLSKPIAIALLVVTASPGGSYSNWWCSTFNADLPLSVAMTTVTSLLSIIFLPFNLFFYSWIAFGVFKVNGDMDSSSIVKSVSFSAIFQSLAVVLSALVIGLVAGYKYDTPRFHNINHKVGSIAGILLIIFSIVVVSGPQAELGSLDWSFYVATMLPCLGGIVLASIGSRMVKLSPPEVLAIAIECCYQNTGIATSVAITMFHDKKERAQAVAVPLFYGICSAGMIFVSCVICWKMGWTKAPANEKIWKVIMTSYEVDEMITNNNDTNNSTNQGNDNDEETATIVKVVEDDGKVFHERNRMNTFDSATATTVSTVTPVRKDSEESDDLEDNDISPVVVDIDELEEKMNSTDTMETSLKP